MTTTPAAPQITARQQEALDWLARVGKATEKSIRANGFAPRTFGALAKAQLIERQVIPQRNAPMPVYRTLPRSPRRPSPSAVSRRANR